MLNAITDLDNMSVHFLIFFLYEFFFHESRYTGDQNLQNIFLNV